MTTITITVKHGEFSDLQKIMKLDAEGALSAEAWDCNQDPPEYVIEVDGPEATYLLELLQFGTQMRGFEPLDAWKRAKTKQMNLPLPGASDPRPGTWTPYDPDPEF